MDLTLSIDDETAAKASAVADRMGLNLSQLVRNYLIGLAVDRGADGDIAEMRQLSLASRDEAQTWRFDRDALHERS